MAFKHFFKQTKRSCRFLLVLGCSVQFELELLFLHFTFVLRLVLGKGHSESTIQCYTIQMIVPIRRNQPACDRSELSKYFFRNQFLHSR